MLGNEPFSSPAMEGHEKKFPLSLMGTHGIRQCCFELLRPSQTRESQKGQFRGTDPLCNCRPPCFQMA